MFGLLSTEKMLRDSPCGKSRYFMPLFPKGWQMHPSRTQHYFRWGTDEHFKNFISYIFIYLYQYLAFIWVFHVCFLLQKIFRLVKIEKKPSYKRPHLEGQPWLYVAPFQRPPGRVLSAWMPPRLSSGAQSPFTGDKKITKSLGRYSKERYKSKCPWEKERIG